MKTYRVIETCIFKKRFLEKGMIVEYEDDIVVPIHLELLPGEKAPEKKPEEGSLSFMQKKQKEFYTPKAGFAAPKQEPEKPKSKK